MSTIVSIGPLPSHTELFVTLTEIYGLHKHEMVDIYTPPGECVVAQVVFKTHEVAKKFADDFDNYRLIVGKFEGQKIGVHLRDEPEAELLEGFTNRLSDLLYARNNHILSRTVEITGFPRNHTLSNLRQLLEPIWEDNDLIEAENVSILLQGGVGLVQLKDSGTALHIMRLFVGTYWKRATLNARLVPDEEIEDLLIKRSSQEDGALFGKDVMLFVTGIEAGTSPKEVQEIFKEFPIRDVNMPPGGKTFCFVFFKQPEANAVLARFGNSVQWKGRTIRVSISNKEKKKNKSALGAVSAPPAALPPDMTDLKLSNLPHAVADSSIRIIFEGFTVSKVIVKQGYAFVGIATSEVGRAIEELSGKMVGGRKISVKVSQRNKQ
ncbi:hypothetical protein AA0119_g9941 [Alternaria tenuissima]|uniref:RRM domain-containing protein n=2 Tax=Alternaria tenuissima TaxID=119927 RepID=A0ABY0FYF4_9PLEO|nr:hypothetical protein AA0120_g10855 [Alternaria tenuissima]RYN92982.1 hypothetical protein AA0119_g9941 [Alternaria tenuissima]RYO45893.1 hypothetical protein AA0116_g13012 [Alternaria tenuissima]